MPMPTRISYAEDIEPLVQFVEETPPAEILDRTLEKLRAGLPIETMLKASALAVTRSTDMPPGHHGGALHPLVGLYAITRLIERLEGEQRFVPVLQHVALANKHIHHPSMGPYQLLEFAPAECADFEEAKAAFQHAVGRGEYNHADHLFQWMWQNVPTIETGLGFYAAALDTGTLPSGTRIDFTWRQQDTGEWRGRNFEVAIAT